MIQRIFKLPVYVISFVLLIFMLALFTHIEAKDESVVDWPPPRLNIEQCVNSLHEVLNTTTSKREINEIIKQMEACTYELHNQGVLDDFQLRRSKFYQQSYADTVILWMVVFITISGIALATLQLLISYRLAVAAGTNLGDMGGEISLEKGKISLKSSLTGIFIIALSFAFFWLFVVDVYQIKIVDPDSQQKTPQSPPLSQANFNNEQKTGPIGLQPGGIGTPPSLSQKSPLPITDSKKLQAQIKNQVLQSGGIGSPPQALLKQQETMPSR